MWENLILNNKCRKKEPWLTTAKPEVQECANRPSGCCLKQTTNKQTKVRWQENIKRIKRQGHTPFCGLPDWKYKINAVAWIPWCNKMRCDTDVGRLSWDHIKYAHYQWGFPLFLFFCSSDFLWFDYCLSSTRFHKWMGLFGGGARRICSSSASSCSGGRSHRRKNNMLTCASWRLII